MSLPAASRRTKALPLPTRRMLSRVEAAELCGVSPNTFDRMQSDGLMPRPKRVYGRVLWDVRALDAAIDYLPGQGETAQANQWD